MRVVTYKSVLEGVLKRRGITPSSAQSEQVMRISEFIADRLRDAWEYYRWPEAMTCDQRYFRAEWVPGAYEEGDEVWHADTEKYWSANEAVLLPEDEPGVSDKWTELTDFRRTVAYAQSGLPEIEAVLSAWDKDPLTYADALRVSYSLSADGVQFGADAPSSVWIEYRSRPNDFAWSEEWSAIAYSSGSIVYKAPEVYRALQDVADSDVPGTSNLWRKQDFPYLLARAVKEAAAADELGAVGQEDKEEAGKFDMVELLEEQVWQLTKLQGQTGRPTVIPNPR